MLPTSWHQAEWWLALPRLEGNEAFAPWVGQGRTEEADAKVPVWLINRAQHGIAGTNFPDAPTFIQYGGKQGIQVGGGPGLQAFHCVQLRP